MKLISRRKRYIFIERLPFDNPDVIKLFISTNISDIEKYYQIISEILLYLAKSNNLNCYSFFADLDNEVVLFTEALLAKVLNLQHYGFLAIVLLAPKIDILKTIKFIEPKISINYLPDFFPPNSEFFFSGGNYDADYDFLFFKKIYEPIIIDTFSSLAEKYDINLEISGFTIVTEETDFSLSDFFQTKFKINEKVGIPKRSLIITRNQANEAISEEEFLNSIVSYILQLLKDFQVSNSIIIRLYGPSFKTKDFEDLINFLTKNHIDYYLINIRKKLLFLPQKEQELWIEIHNPHELQKILSQIFALPALGESNIFLGAKDKIIQKIKTELFEKAKQGIDFNRNDLDYYLFQLFIDCDFFVKKLDKKGKKDKKDAFQIVPLKHSIREIKKQLKILI